MKNYRPAGVALSILFMLLFLGTLGLRIWASGKSTETVGPDHIAVGQDRVYVHMNGAVFVLSADGKLLATKKIEPLIHDNSLIDLRVLPDGRVLLARQQPAGMALCDPVSWQCDPVGQGMSAKISGQFKVLADEPSQQFFITDFSSGLWSQPFKKGEPQPLVSPDTLLYPNDIAMDADGRLWIADSGHHRLVAFERKGDGRWEKVHELEARNRLIRPGRDWPMMLAMGADGNWWVTQPTRHGGKGDLLVYQPENGAQSRIDLPEDAYPTDVASLGAAMLVTDMDKFKIYRVDTSSHVLGEFGDAAFRERMSQAAAHKAGYQTMVDQSVIGMVAFGALMMLAAFWASPKGKRLTPVLKVAPLIASGAAMPVLKEIYWLKRNPKTERMLRWAKPLAFVVPIVIVAMLGFQFFLLSGAAGATNLTPEKLKKLEELKTLLFMLAFFILGLPIVALNSLRSLKRRLGTDGQRLFIMLDNGRRISLAPEQLVYSTQLIAYQGYIFPIQTGKKQPLYEAGEIETFIAPLLRRAKKLNAWNIFRYLVEQREPVTMTTLIFAIMLLAMMYATGMWRQLLPGLG
ncbi:MAG: hypothetical protein ACYC9K_03635 [Sulfuricaulis sp.]